MSIDKTLKSRSRTRGRRNSLSKTNVPKIKPITIHENDDSVNRLRSAAATTSVTRKTPRMLHARKSSRKPQLDQKMPPSLLNNINLS